MKFKSVALPLWATNLDGKCYDPGCGNGCSQRPDDPLEGLVLAEPGDRIVIERVGEKYGVEYVDGAVERYGEQ